VTIYSFDAVLRQRKMVHSVQVSPGSKDKIALWRPLSWMSILYFAIVELVFVIAAKLPVLNIPYEIVATFFAPAIYYLLPAGVVWLLFNAQLDGRAPHLWAYSYLLFLVRPKRTLGARSVRAAGQTVSYAGKVKIWWDLHAPRLHHGWVIGGRVTTNVPVRFTHAIFHSRQIMVFDPNRSVGTPDRLDPTAIAIGHEVQGKLQVKP
jgi:hypothetical protein